MYLPSITVFLTLVPLLWIFLILWRERAHVRSLSPFIVGASFISLARLLDVPLELPSLQLSRLLGHSTPEVDTAMVVLGDTADIVGIGFLVSGFSQTLRSLRAVQTEVRDLQSLLPICAWCKRIRESDGAWESIEHYIVKSGLNNVTHGICPDCAARIKEKHGTSRGG